MACASFRPDDADYLDVALRLTRERTRETTANLHRAPAVATPRIVTNIFGIFLLTAAIPAFACTFALDVATDREVLIIRGTALLAFALGIVVPLTWRELPAATYHPIVVIATAMITIVAVCAEGSPVALMFTFFYVYIVIACSFFFSLASGIIEMLVTVAASTWVYHQLHVNLPGTLVAEVVLVVTFCVAVWLARTADQAEIDPLTGLANRRALARNLEEAVDRASKEGGLLSFVLLDIDHFKDVNDSAGHAAGDELLIACAKAWREVCPDPRFLSRHGGDEFSLILPGYSIGRAAELADTIRNALPAGTTASAGVAAWGHGDSASTLTSRTDVALYEAKTSGRNRTKVYGDAGHLTRELEAAIVTGDLVMLFQDVVHLPTGDVTGREGLVRWNHPVRGVVPPDEFIPRAEQTGAIHLLGQWTLDKVCRVAGATKLDAAVNVSVSELRNPGYADRVQEALARNDCAAEHLIIEVTEAAYDHRDDQVLHTIQALRGIGIRIAIDDFGDGYASLRWLAKFPVDILKIDGGFIKRLEGDEKVVQVVSAIFALGRALNVHVVAEQVETEAQVRILKSIGCQLVQGYYFGRPRTIDI